jgi:hypothetical protein
MNNFFIDSTVWVEFFKGKNTQINELIVPLIDEDKIFYNGIILSELLIGAKNNKEFNFLKSNFAGFNYLETDESIFEDTSRIGFKLKKEGISIPLTDLIITAHCIKYNLVIVTFDEHFKLINKKLNLKLLEV